MDMPISIRKDADRDADANASVFFSKDDPNGLQTGGRKRLFTTTWKQTRNFLKEKMICQLRLAGCLLGKAGLQERGYREGCVPVGSDIRLWRHATTAGHWRSSGM